jgi:hypothetical protein
LPARIALHQFVNFASQTHVILDLTIPGIVAGLLLWSPPHHASAGSFAVAAAANTSDSEIKFLFSKYRSGKFQMTALRKSSLRSEQ